jgi:hypothetical protein
MHPRVASIVNGSDEEAGCVSMNDLPGVRALFLEGRRLPMAFAAL